MSRAVPLRVLVVDDEPPARERLTVVLDGQDGIEVVGSVGSGRAAVEAIRRDRPDLVLLDVQMPETGGLDVVREVGPGAMPAVVFVTAYDRYALQAFDLAAVDYLLKPFEDERLLQALDRVRERVRLQEAESLGRRLRTLLDAVEGGGTGPTAPGDYLRRLAVDDRGGQRIVPVDRIDYVSASGPYAEVHVGERTFLVRERMHVLEGRLDPERFCRVHRSTIVNLDRVEAVRQSSRGGVAVLVRGGPTLRVSRSRREELERRLGLRF